MYRVKITYGGFTLERRFFWHWVGLDVTNVWCNWYFKTKPRVFNSLEDVKQVVFVDSVTKNEPAILRDKINKLEEKIKEMATQNAMLIRVNELKRKNKKRKGVKK